MSFKFKGLEDSELKEMISVKVLGEVSYDILTTLHLYSFPDEGRLGRL